MARAEHQLTSAPLPAVHAGIAPRYRIACIGSSAPLLVALLDRMRRRGDVELVELPSVLGLAELLVFRRFDLLVVEECLDPEVLARVLRAVSSVAVGPVPRVWRCGQDSAQAASQVDRWIEVALGVAP